MSETLCVIKGDSGPDITVKSGSEGRLFLCRVGLTMSLSEAHAYALSSFLIEYFTDRPDFVDCGPVANPDPDPAEDTVSLLCAAARKWAKWDARAQAAYGVHADGGIYIGLMNKRDKFRDRTLSYGHHLLSAGVADGQMESADLAVFRNSVVREFKRLDTLVQQLCARVAVLEDWGRTSQL